MVAPTPSSSSAQDPSLALLARMLPHLDRQLVLPLLDFLESRDKYAHDDVLRAKIDLLGDGKTNMVTFVESLKRELEGKDEGEEVEGAAGESRSSLSSTPAPRRGGRIRDLAILPCQWRDRSCVLLAAAALHSLHDLPCAQY